MARLVDIEKHIGSRIKVRRNELQLTQRAFVAKAKGLGLPISQGELSAWETGSGGTSAARLYLLALLLNVRPDYFFVGLQDTVVSEGKVRGVLQEIVPATTAVS